MEKATAVPLSTLAPGTPVALIANGELDHNALYRLDTDAYIYKLPERAILISADNTSYSDRLVARLLCEDQLVQFVGPSAQLQGRVLGPRTGASVRTRAVNGVLQNAKRMRLLNWAVTVGSDPELWVVDGESHLIPAGTFLGSKKQNSHNFFDGFQAEFTHQCDTCLERMQSYIRDGLVATLKAAKAKNSSARIELHTVQKLDEVQMLNANEDWVRFGCSPSKNAYDEQPITIEDPRKILVRSIGGHQHFGVYGERLRNLVHKNWKEIVKTLDKTAGIASVSLAGIFDSPERRDFDGKGHGYGRAGECRLPVYGIEYRVPSAFWLCAPWIYMLYWDFSRQGLQLGLNQLGHLIDAPEEEVREVINHTDVGGARAIIERNKAVFKCMLNANYGSEAVAETGYNTILNGVESACQDPFDVTRNWELTDYSRWFDVASKRYWFLAAGLICSNHKPIR